MRPNHAICIFLGLRQWNLNPVPVQRYLMTNYKDISFYKKTFIHNKVWRGRLCSSMMHWFVLYYIHVCQFVCFKYIYAWTNYFEQIFLCPGPCGFGLLDTLLFHVSLFLSVNMQSWTRTRSILRLRNPCVLTSRYLLICPTLKRGLICAGKGQQLNSVLTILKIQLKKIFWAFWVFFTEHSTRPTYLIHIPLPAFLNCSWFLSWSPNICQN